ncbi:unnamed protein product, partial [Porites lobata]
NLGPFDERSEKFSDYADRFENMLRRMTSTMTKKVNVFLAVIGPDAYKLLKNLHYEPAPIVIAERHKFWTASQ